MKPKLKLVAIAIAAAGVSIAGPSAFADRDDARIQSHQDRGDRGVRSDRGDRGDRGMKFDRRSERGDFDRDRGSRHVDRDRGDRYIERGARVETRDRDWRRPEYRGRIIRGHRYEWGPGVAFYFSDGYYYGECGWLKRRALVTGDPIWWRRFHLCREFG